VREAKPNVIVNAGAYTAVDRAESERELAMQINGVAPGILAEEAKRAAAFLVHYSTDYVFDGRKTAPYTEEDSPNPLNVYGKTKHKGELAVAAVGCRYLTLRTSWVYASRGQNFLLKILRLASTQSQLRVVNDQHGAPTWAREIALNTLQLLGRPEVPMGLYHLTAAGETTWYGFAGEILRLAEKAGMVQPISTAEYATPAVRPANSLLSNAKLYRASGVSLPDWSVSLAACLSDMLGEAVQ
jgi:dTDP-4-dehydrorhamnose reductase